MHNQSFADLLICRQDWSVLAYSESLPALTGEPHRFEIGVDLAQAMGRQFAHDARGWGQALAVSAQVPRSFSYQFKALTFDIACHRHTEGYCIVIEPGVPDQTFASDIPTRRLLQRCRGLAGRSEAIGTALKVLRLSLRADSVTLLRCIPEHGMIFEAHDHQPGSGLSPIVLPAALYEEVLGSMGLVADTADQGCSLIGAERPKDLVLPSWLQLPSATLTGLFEDRGFRSAHWYAGTASGGDQYCLLVEHIAAGAVDAIRRYATELALEVLLLLLDAEYPLSDGSRAGQ